MVEGGADVRKDRLVMRLPDEFSMTTMEVDYHTTEYVDDLAVRYSLED